MDPHEILDSQKDLKLTFQIPGTLMEFRHNGEIWIKGRLVGTDKEVMEGMRDLVSGNRAEKFRKDVLIQELELAKNQAYWERNVLALKYAEGWYNDDEKYFNGLLQSEEKIPRYEGWRRVLSLEGGKYTFHIPDNFNVGDLKEIERNWDGHSSEEKWKRILKERGIHD